jgi:hypothetical protein
MTKAKESFQFVDDENDRDFLKLFSFICILCFDVYLRKHVIEQVIDNYLKPGVVRPGVKAEIKEDNSKSKNKIN